MEGGGCTDSGRGTMGARIKRALCKLRSKKWEEETRCPACQSPNGPH